MCTFKKDCEEGGKSASRTEQERLMSRLLSGLHKIHLLKMTLAKKGASWHGHVCNLAGVRIRKYTSLRPSMYIWAC